MFAAQYASSMATQKGGSRPLAPPVDMAALGGVMTERISTQTQETSTFVDVILDSTDTTKALLLPFASTTTLP
jgi:hypothetical protein